MLRLQRQKLIRDIALSDISKFPFAEVRHFCKPTALYKMAYFFIVLPTKHIIKAFRYFSTCKVRSDFFSSIQFSLSVMSDSLRPHELQHTRPPCPSPTPRVYSNSCPSSRWCHPTISSSVIPFSSCPQSFPESGSFQMSQPFTWGGQSWSFSFNISPSNEHLGLIFFRMDWLDLLAVQGTLKTLHQYQKSINSSTLSFLYSPTLTSIHDDWKNHSLD